MRVLIGPCCHAAGGDKQLQRIGKYGFGGQGGGVAIPSPLRRRGTADAVFRRGYVAGSRELTRRERLEQGLVLIFKMLIFKMPCPGCIGLGRERLEVLVKPCERAFNQEEVGVHDVGIVGQAHIPRQQNGALAVVLRDGLEVSRRMQHGHVHGLADIVFDELAVVGLVVHIDVELRVWYAGIKQDGSVVLIRQKHDAFTRGPIGLPGG